MDPFRRDERGLRHVMPGGSRLIPQLKPNRSALVERLGSKFQVTGASHRLPFNYYLCTTGHAAGNLMQRALLMTLYGTGMRRTEVSMLKVRDIDSRRMMIRVERGKGGDSRDLPLSPALLETLREYWRWKKPRIYLFPQQHRSTRSGHTHLRQDRLVCL